MLVHGNEWILDGKWFECNRPIDGENDIFKTNERVRPHQQDQTEIHREITKNIKIYNKTGRLQDELESKTYEHKNRPLNISQEEK